MTGVEKEVVVMDAPEAPEEEQNPEVCREIRTNLRELLNETKRSTAELLTGEVNELERRLSDCNSIFKVVVKPREGALEAKIVSSIADLGKERSLVLLTDSNNFSTADFAQRVRRVINGENSMDANNDAPADISVVDWGRFGRGCRMYLKQAPPLGFMFGSFARTAAVGQTKKVRVARATDKDDNIASTAPKQLGSLSEMPKKEMTTVEVDKIHRQLRHFYAQSGQRPICYFEFVINPCSFEQSVENIFYTSFLIKDGFAKLFLDEDKLPVIIPIEQDETGGARGDTPMQSVIITLTRQNWKDIVTEFKLSKCIIATRPTTHHSLLNRRL